MKPAIKPRAIDTRERILDAAEELFIEHGFAATSLRAIASRAAVNLAATNYHFGSKDGLLAAVFHRNVHPLNDERLAQLRRLEESGRSLTLRELLEAFLYPLKAKQFNERLPAVMGRMFSEPESITRPILEQEFAEVAERYLSAAAKVLPELTPEQLQWRFHLMIGSMIHLLKFHQPIISSSSDKSIEEGIEYLIEYSIAGLSSKKEISHD